MFAVPLVQSMMAGNFPNIPPCTGQVSITSSSPLGDLMTSDGNKVEVNSFLLVGDFLLDLLFITSDWNNSMLSNFILFEMSLR